ncbi:MAG TPA: acyltransferase [Bacillota bacterium]|jgi:UDP-2-acetamido-3-amino-2,3-dideoxy-glucuronate N-acetyltransferase|nr:acyltransferase [Bacillota bacterium]
MTDNNFFVHPTAIVDENCTIGEGTRIWHWSHVMHDVVIGSHCNIGEHAFIENGVILGNCVKVKNNVALYTGVECEDDVFLGPNCVFTNVHNPRSFIERKSEIKKTIIRKGATIGANATIVCGNEIGEYAFIGAGSVVTKPVPAYTMVIGNPAKEYARVCKCGVKLDENLHCIACGKQYTINNDGDVSPITE